MISVQKNVHAQTLHKLFGLDHLRAVAIIFVFVFHYGRMFPHPEWTNSISEFGWTGVDLFFVLSGYLISSQLFFTIAQQKNISIKTFFIKRFFRIIPAYIFIVAIYFLFPFCREREALAPLWKYVTFTQNMALDLRTQGTFSHAWSLCIEEQFYLLLPLILMALVYCKVIKKSYILLIVLFAFSFLIRYYLWNKMVVPFTDDEDSWAYWYKWIYYPTFCRLDGLLVGVSIAAIFQFYPKFAIKMQQNANVLFFVSVMVLTNAYFICLNQQSFNASMLGFPLVSLGYGLLVISAISTSNFLYKYQSTVTSTIATLSYSIYLSHKIIIHITQSYIVKLGIKDNSNYMFIICITTCLIGALVMNKLIEKPFLSLRNKILKMK